MFKRRVEKHQGESFLGLEAARQFANEAEKSTMRYRAFLNTVRKLDIQGKYLDVGAGTGNLAAIIAQSNPSVEITALEISADMVTIGEELVRKKGIQNQIEFVQGDAVDQESVQALGEFDLIYSTYALHHWEDPKRVVDNLMSILHEGGILYLYDLRRVWWLYWVPKQNGFFNSIRAAYIRKEIRDMLDGFKSESVEILHEFPFMQSIIIKNT